MYTLKEVCYMTTSIPAIHFFCGGAIIKWNHLRGSICQGHFVYFMALVLAIHYNKQSVANWGKFEGHVYMRKAIVAVLF